MELFTEQGFAATSVPQIAARAGLTTRTFFRHYSDKREVLFEGEQDLPALVASMFTSASADLSPIEVVRRGIRTVLGPRMEELKGDLLARERIIVTDDGLQERQLRKLAILHGAAAQSFRQRGLTDLEADFISRLALAVYQSALTCWLAGDKREFHTIATDLLDSLPELSSPLAHSPPANQETT